MTTTLLTMTPGLWQYLNVFFENSRAENENRRQWVSHFIWELLTISVSSWNSRIIRCCQQMWNFEAGWMDDLRFYVLFNSISVISGQWEVDNERLCAMELHLRLKRFSLKGILKSQTICKFIESDAICKSFKFSSIRCNHMPSVNQERARSSEEHKHIKFWIKSEQILHKASKKGASIYDLIENWHPYNLLINNITGV